MSPQTYPSLLRSTLMNVVDGGARKRLHAAAGWPAAVAPTGAVQKTRRHELVPELRFPPGYHFLPTDEELVDVYLRAKIEGRAPPLDVIKEVDILQSEPHVLVGNYKPYGDSRWFFFTRRKKSASNKKNEPCRKLLCTDDVGVTASWKATGSVAKILRGSGTREGQVVGTKRILIYHSNVADEDDKWSMNEYVMADYPGMDQWVLCTIQTKLRWGANSKSAKKHKREEHITNTKPKTTKRRKKTATSQAQKETVGTFDDGSAYPPPLLMHEQDPHHQALHEEDYPLALDNNNTSLIVEHPAIAEDHHQTLHGDHCQLEDLQLMQQQATYDMPNNLQDHHHHPGAYHFARYQPQELVTFDYQSWQLQQQQEEMPRYNDQVGMQVFVRNIAAGSFSGQKHRKTSPDSVLRLPFADGYSSTVQHESNLGEQQAPISAGDPCGRSFADSLLNNYGNAETIALPEMMNDQASSSMCPQDSEWWGSNTCLVCVHTSGSYQ